MRVRLATLEDLPWLKVTYGKMKANENSYIDPGIMREAIQHKQMIVSKGEDALCIFYQRKRDKVVTVYNIWVKEGSRRKGLANEILILIGMLCRDAPEIVARCPVSIEANEFYEHVGFQVREVSEPVGKRKVALNVWVRKFEEVIK